MSSRSLVAVLRVALWACAAATHAGTKPAAPQNGLFTIAVPADWDVRAGESAVTAKDPKGEVDLVCNAAPKKPGHTLEQFAREVSRLAEGVLGWTRMGRRETEIAGLPGLELSGTEKAGGGDRYSVFFLAVSDTHDFQIALSCPEQAKDRWAEAFRGIAASWQIPGQGAPAPIPPRPAVGAMRELKDPRGAFTIQLPADWKSEVQNGKIWASAGGSSFVAWSRPRQRKSVGEMADQAAATSSAVARDLGGSWREDARTPLKLGGTDGLRVRATRDSVAAKDSEDNYFVLTRDHEIDIEFVAPQEEFGPLEKTVQAIIASLQVPAGQVPPPAPPPQPPPPTPLPQPIPPQPIIPAPVPEPPSGPFPPLVPPPPGPPPTLQPQPFPSLFPTPQPAPAPAPAAPKEVADPTGLFAFTVPGDWMAFASGGGNAMAYPPGAKSIVSILGWSKIALSFDQFVQGWVEGQRLSPSIKFLAQSAGQVAGRRAMHFLTEGDLVGNPVRTDSYLIDGDRHVFSASLVCAKDDYAALQPLFAQIVANLRFNVRPAQPQPQVAPETYQPFPTPQPFPQPPPAQPVPAPMPLPAPTPVPGLPAPGAMKQVVDPEGLFRFSVPADWQVQQQARAAFAFDATRPASAALRVEPKQAQSLEHLAQAAIAGWRQQVPQWQEVSRQAIQVAGRPALVIRASGAPGGAAVVGDHVLLLTDTWQAGLTVWCPQADFAQREALFQQIIQSLQVR